MYSDSFSSIILLPHRCVTQRQDPHMGKCLDIQFYDILSHGQQLFSDSCHKGGYWSTRPVYWKLSLSLAKLQHVFCLNSQVSTTWSILVALPNSMAEGDDNTCLYLLRTKTGLVDLNFLPTCVLHSGTSTCLRVNLTYLCAIWADGYTAQINLKTLSKPMVWSDAYKCCFFFCLLYEMCYFALSLLKHTFLKKQIMWMFTVYGLVFFSATSYFQFTTFGDKYFTFYSTILIT